MIICSNVHTHTVFGDGSNTPEEMVLGAIEAGFHTLGFSEHSPLDSYDGWTMTDESRYIQEINRLKAVYGDRINILLGIEQDYFSKAVSYDYDYVIGSVHATIKNGERLDLDLSPEMLKSGIEKLYGGNAMALVRDYYALVAGVPDKTNCDIVGHFDLITKFNDKHRIFDTDSKEYKRVAFDALDALLPKDKLFEINTGAISRGWKTSPYPSEPILRRMAEKGAKIIITSDAHARSSIACGFDAAVQYAKNCGVRALNIYRGKDVEMINV